MKKHNAKLTPLIMQPEKTGATSSLVRSDERYRNATRLWLLNGRQEMKKHNAKLTPLILKIMKSFFDMRDLYSGSGGWERKEGK